MNPQPTAPTAPNSPTASTYEPSYQEISEQSTTEDDSEDEEEELRKLEERKQELRKKKQEKEEKKELNKFLLENPNPKDEIIKIMEEYEIEEEDLTNLKKYLNSIPYEHKPPQKETKTRARKGGEQIQPQFLKDSFKNNTALRCLYCKSTYIAQAKNENGEPIPTENFKNHLKKCKYTKKGAEKQPKIYKDDERRRS